MLSIGDEGLAFFGHDAGVSCDRDVQDAPGAVGQEEKKPAGPKRPNVLFIMSDDHASQAISCYGSKLIDTPNIDRIAKEGVQFQNSFVTNSICAPSRATLLTGKYSHSIGFHDNQIFFDGNQRTGNSAEVKCTAIILDYRVGHLLVYFGF